MYDRIEQEGVGPLDVLINNAGIHRRAPLEEMTVEDWTTVVEVNLNAVFYVSQCVGRAYDQTPGGQDHQY